MSFHLYDIDEIFSSADGTVQFIELTVPNNSGENLWAGHAITVTENGVTHSFTFPTNLPSAATANTHVLIATQGFANLGIVTPDFIVPNGFLFTDGGSVTVNYAFVDSVTYSTDLPLNGSNSLNFSSGGVQVQGRTGTVGVASPTDFAGVTGTISLAGSPINGTSGDDVLNGTPGADTINGLAGNDSLFGNGGQDTLDGGSGTDTAVVNARLQDVTTLSSTHLAAGTIDLSMTSVERVKLADTLVVFDTHAGEAAWQAQAILCAGFGEAGALAALPQWISHATESVGMSALAQQIVDFYAPGISSAALVAYLYGSIAGVTPTQAQVDQFANDVGPGKTYATNGALLAFAASLQLNTDKMVDFVGTVQHLDIV
ncbi:MAG: calcium-binding protein [Ramlibacter sp.]